MKRPSFLQGVALAVALSLAGAAITAALQFLGFGNVLRVVITGAAFAYVVYLLLQSPERVGRISSLAIWMLAAAVLWLWSPSLILYVLLHALVIWLVRAFHYHGNIAAALADFGLGALALAAGIWAFAASCSLFAALWSYFLVQALFVTIPPRLFHHSHPSTTTDDSFEQAWRIADAAARRILTH